MRILLLLLISVSSFGQIMPGIIASQKKSSGTPTPVDVFSPADLPGVRGWWIADSAVLSGSNIESVPNEISGGFSIEKVSDGTRPIIATSELNGHSAIDFDGSDKLFGDVLDIQSRDMTCFVVFKADATSGATRRNLVNNCNASAVGFSLGVVNNNAEFFWRSGATQSFTETASYHVIMGKAQWFTTGSTNLRVFKVDNGTAVASVVATQSSSTAIHFNVGNNEAANEGFDGKIAEIIFVENVVTESEELQVYEYLNGKYAMSIPTTMPEYTFQSGSLTYASTFDVITDLGYQFSISGKAFGKKSPIIMLGHGYNDDIGAFTTTIKARMANMDSGYYLLAVNGRERSGAGGTRDSGGRELLDILDAMNNSYTIHGDLIDVKKRIGSGYSGGGGWVVGAAAKFPNLFSVTVDNFGITDYAYNYNSNSWYEQLTPGGPSQQTMEEDIFYAADEDPADFLNESRSRDHRGPSAVNHHGYMFMIHDADDSAVDPVQSEKLKEAWDSVGRTDYSYNISTSDSTNRYLHGYPDLATNPGLVASELLWRPMANEREVSLFVPSGQYLVAGYVVSVDDSLNRKFQLFLGDGVEEANDGKNRTAIFDFDYYEGTFTITPQLETGATSTTYAYEDDLGRTASGTISGETPTTINLDVFRTYTAMPTVPTFTNTQSLSNGSTGNSITLAELGGKTDLLINGDYPFIQANGWGDNTTYRIRSTTDTDPSTWAWLGQFGEDLPAAGISNTGTTMPNIELYNIKIHHADAGIKWGPYSSSRSQKYQNVIVDSTGFAGLQINSAGTGLFYGDLTISYLMGSYTEGELTYLGRTGGAEVSLYTGVTTVSHVYGYHIGREVIQLNGHAEAHVSHVTGIGDGVNLGEGIGQNNPFQAQNIFTGSLTKSIFINFLSPGVIATHDFLFEDNYTNWITPDRPFYVQNMVANSYDTYVNPGGTIVWQGVNIYDNPDYTGDVVFLLQDPTANYHFKDTIWVPASATDHYADQRISPTGTITDEAVWIETNDPPRPTLGLPPEEEYQAYQKVVTDPYFYSRGFGCRTPDPE